jgi:hypothetical protein
LRSTYHLYSNDDEFHQLSLYVRHNRAQQGHLKIGDQAIDIQLLTMNGEFVSLLSHCHPNRPLLIIAGSYTCYIKEAHESDEWLIGSRICYIKPKSDDDGIGIANDFIQTIVNRVVLLIDPVSNDNPFSKMYSSGPIRFDLIDQMKKLSYIAQPIECSYPLELIKNVLDEVI